MLGNVELALTISGVSKAERRRRAAAALEQVGPVSYTHLSVVESLYTKNAPGGLVAALRGHPYIRYALAHTVGIYSISIRFGSVSYTHLRSLRGISVASTVMMEPLSSWGGMLSPSRVWIGVQIGRAHV